MLKIQLIGDVRAPDRGTKESAGLDFYAPEDFTMPPHSSMTIPLNVRTKIQPGWALKMVEKSGLASKKEIIIGACLIDSDYRGIIHANLFNKSSFFHDFKKGDKIVQGVVMPVWMGTPEIVEEINEDETERGTGGFGSTGER